MAPELSCFCMTSNPGSSGSKTPREKAENEGLDGDLPGQLFCLETRLQQHGARLQQRAAGDEGVN